MAKKLISGQALIYEHVDGITYARYRDPPHNKIDRWIVGGTPKALGYGNLVSYTNWKECIAMAEKHPTLKKQLDNLIQTYMLLKESK